MSQNERLIDGTIVAFKDYTILCNNMQYCAIT